MLLTNILLGLLVVVCGVISFLIFQYKTKVETTLNNISNNSNSLNNTLIQHKSAVEKMPISFNEIVSEELNKGLGETVGSIKSLQTELTTNHKAFNNMVENIPQLDQMPVWLSEVKETIAPLKTAAMNLESLDDKVIERFNTFMGGRDKMQTSFTEISNLIAEWTTSSGVEREEFKRLVKNHLENLNSQTHKMNESLSSMQKFTKNNEDLMEGISKTLPDTVVELVKFSKTVNHFMDATEVNTKRVNSLLQEWEKREKNQQFLIYLGYGFITLNIGFLIYIIANF